MKLPERSKHATPTKCPPNRLCHVAILGGKFSLNNQTYFTKFTFRCADRTCGGSGNVRKAAPIAQNTPFWAARIEF